MPPFPLSVQHTNVLVLFVSGLFTSPFTSQCCFHSSLLSWFQVEGMLFDFFNDVLLLNLPLEATQRVLQRLSVLKSNFSQSINTPVSIRKMNA